MIGAIVRSARRAVFIQRAENGQIAGYRVDTSSAGRVLVRVAKANEPYRAADMAIDACPLDTAELP